MSSGLVRTLALPFPATPAPNGTFIKEEVFMEQTGASQAELMKRTFVVSLGLTAVLLAFAQVGYSVRMGGRTYALSRLPDGTDHRGPPELTITLPREYDISLGGPHWRATYFKDRHLDLTFAVAEGGHYRLFVEQDFYDYGMGKMRTFYAPVERTLATWHLSKRPQNGETLYCAEALVFARRYNVWDPFEERRFVWRNHSVHVFITGTDLEEVLSHVRYARTIRFLR